VLNIAKYLIVLQMLSGFKVIDLLHQETMNLNNALNCACVYMPDQRNCNHKCLVVSYVFTLVPSENNRHTSRIIGKRNGRIKVYLPNSLADNKNKICFIPHMNCSMVWTPMAEGSKHHILVIPVSTPNLHKC
jgi:hypothetical protein